MLNDSWLEFLAIRSVILFFSSIGGASFIYTVWNLCRLDVLSRLAQVCRSPIQIWLTAEAFWHVFMLWYRIHIQSEAVHPPLRSREERKKLFDQVRSEVHDPEQFLRGWFRGADSQDVGREDMKTFIDWAFFEGRADSSDQEEMEDFTQQVEKMMGRPFKAGHGSAKSLRLTLDPIEVDGRPLLWYMIIMLVDTSTHMRLVWNGFQHFGSPKTNLQVFPPRPATLAFSRPSPVELMSYWCKPHTSKTCLPVLFIHGIGVGLHPYIPFLQELHRALNAGTESDETVGILALEVLQVSSRLTTPILRKQQFLEQLTRILDDRKYDRFVLASHSFGSVHNAHVLNDSALSSRVDATLLVDPVSILLHMPDVAYNFTVRPPRYANEWQLSYFASKDPGVAHTLGRHFFWSESLLSRAHITKLEQNGTRITVSLSGRDLIVDTEGVAMYLMEARVPDPGLTTDEKGQTHMALEADKSVNDNRLDWKTQTWHGRGVEVLWHEDLDHAQVFDHPETRGQLVKVLEEYSKFPGK